MIPKILHFIWFGESRLSEEYVARILRWSELNPGYHVNIWTTSDENIADLLERTAAATIDHEVQISIKNIHKVGEVFGNYDLMQEMFALNAVLAAIDIFKVDLMVHVGGVCIDLGVIPKAVFGDLTAPSPLKDGSTITTRADYRPPMQGSINCYCYGEYHFHASAPGGEVYTLAQKVGRQLLASIKHDALFSQVFTSNNPLVRYKATVATTGQFLFLAIDCLARLGRRDLKLIQRVDFKRFGERKSDALRKRDDTGEDLGLSQKFGQFAQTQAEYIRWEYLTQDLQQFEQRFPEGAKREKGLNLFRQTFRLDLFGGYGKYPDYVSIQRLMWNLEPRNGWNRPEWHGPQHLVAERAENDGGAGGGGGAKVDAEVSLVGNRRTLFAGREVPQPVITDEVVKNPLGHEDLVSPAA
jgi:hypothetical protein